MKKSEKGITLVALVITIIILLIIASIASYGGKEIIKKAQLEELKTNMLLIQAKAREYVEMANFKIGFASDETEEGQAEIARVRKEVYEDEAKLQPATASIVISPSGVLYKVTNEAMQEWGLNKIKLSDGEEYLIEFNDKDVKVEIYNTVGFNENGTVMYSLTELELIQE